MCHALARARTHTHTVEIRERLSFPIRLIGDAAGSSPSSPPHLRKYKEDRCVCVCVAERVEKECFIYGRCTYVRMGVRRSVFKRGEFLRDSETVLLKCERVR